MLVIESYYHLGVGMVFTERKIIAMLRQHGCKITPQRRAVLSVITRSHEHLTPADIHERVRKEYSSIGLVTVYRTLETLAGLGFICQVHAGGNCRSYLMRRPSEHHHHIICAECGTVVDFTGCDFYELERKLSQETGFKIDKHFLEFSGRCRDCRGRISVNQRPAGKKCD
ncbi:Fur family transcriptional regulator [Chloroflexota bacterium]